jgi:hypothetical protein
VDLEQSLSACKRDADQPGKHTCSTSARLCLNVLPFARWYSSWYRCLSILPLARYLTSRRRRTRWRRIHRTCLYPLSARRPSCLPVLSHQPAQRK